MTKSEQNKDKTVDSCPEQTAPVVDSTYYEGLDESVKYFRKPGFDAFTIITPLLTLAFFLLTMMLVQFVVIFVNFKTDPNLAAEFVRYRDAGAADKLNNLLNDVVMQNFGICSSAYSVVQIIALSIFLAKQNKREKNYLLHANIRPLNLLLIVLVVCAAMGISQLWMLLVQYLASKYEFWRAALENYSAMTMNFQMDNIFLMILSVSILVPTAEELVFRGVLVSEFRRVMPNWVAVVLTAFVFALAHNDLIQSPYAFIVGVMLGLVYIWTNSIYYSIFMHMLFNFLGSVLPMLLTNVGKEAVNNNLLIFYFVMIIFGLAALVYLAKQNGRNEHKAEPVIRPEYLATK